MSTRDRDYYQYTKKILLLDIEKTRYCYLAVLYLFSFFGDVFLRLHLRDLCYTGHNETPEIGKLLRFS